MPYKINADKFADGPSLVEAYQAAKEAPMPKLNVKIRKSDLRIIDNISKQSGTPRSQILNSMIEFIIGTMLQDLAKDNKHCAALVAKHADAIDGVNHMSRGSWSDTLFYAMNADLNYYYGPELEDAERFGGLTTTYRIIEERFTRLNR